MGGICDHPQEENVLYTTKSLPSTYSAFKSPRFYFSTQPLSKLDAQCLLIITNDPSNLQKNDFIKRMLNKTKFNKISSQFKNYMKGNKLKPRQYVLFSVSVVGLDFTKICVLYFPQEEARLIFQEATQDIVQGKLIGTFRNCIDHLKQNKIVSLVITQFCWKSWIYKGSGFKSLAKVIISFQHFNAAVFCCVTQQSQSLAMKTIQQLIKPSK